MAVTTELLPHPGCPKPVWTRPMYSTAYRWPEDSHFDHASAARVTKFVSLLHHFKGEFAGQPFLLLPWQEHELFMPLFGWKVGKTCAGKVGGSQSGEPAFRADGSCTCPRRYRNLYLETPLVKEERKDADRRRPRRVFGVRGR